MTCIRFFTHGAHSYVQLGEKQRWLVRAKEHMRAFLQEQQNRRKTFSSSSSSSFRKKMSSSDVSRSDTSYTQGNRQNEEFSDVDSATSISCRLVITTYCCVVLRSDT